MFVWTDPYSIGWVTDKSIFFFVAKIFLFQIHSHSDQPKIFLTSLSPY